MTITSTAPPALSRAMREGSQPEHEAAEGSAFMSELLAGRVSEVGYAAYLLRLREVYAALEDGVRRRAAGPDDDPLVAAVHDPALERLSAIETDLDHWAPGWQAVAPGDSPAATAYCERLHAAALADGGGALVAHHYTRYLGDLSGGQAIGRLLDRAFALDGAGVAFYSFAGVPKPKPYKDRYRARLDALGLPPAEVGHVVDEVKVAFGLNQALFVELGARLGDYRR